MQEQNIGIVIQARTGSTRLPQKIIMPFYKNQSILEIILNKLKKLNLPIIVATTKNKSDNIIEEISHKHGIRVHRGETDNVLKRMIDAAKQIKIKSVIRVCADNPFLDIQFLLDLISFYIKKEPDYVSFSLKDNLPVIKSHQGFWAEIAKLSALEKVLELTSEKIYLEHVTNFLYSNDKIFNIEFIKIGSNKKGILNKLLQLVILTVKTIIISFKFI